MKASLIVGILLLIIGFSLASAENRPLTGLSPLGKATSTFSIVAGFVLIGLSSVLYLKKHAR